MSGYNTEEIQLLKNCKLCPHSCGTNRFSNANGYCKSNAGFNISSICVHKGEEPVISGKKGICNIFFSHCNLQCIYCQNYTISRNSELFSKKLSQFEVVIHTICDVLEQTENIVGFVSPSHNIPQVMAIIRGLHQRGKHPVVVYNTNGYDKPSSLRMLEEYVDVYLPDFKYFDPGMAFEYSGVKDYPEIAASALKEMYRQKGSTLLVNDDGIAEWGIIIRHLILPGASDQSISVLKYIAEEISPDFYISLMAQYYPISSIDKYSVLNRTITSDEYNKVLEAYHKFGFYRGWTQEMESNESFRPDFSFKDPFD